MIAMGTLLMGLGCGSGPTGTGGKEEATVDSGTTAGSGGGTTDTADPDGDGWTGAQGDCEPSDAAISPGAEELPLNGFDENCDYSDAGPASRVAASPSFASGSELAIAGSLLSAADIDQDGTSEVLLTTWAYEPSKDPGAFDSSVLALSLGCATGLLDGDDVLLEVADLYDPQAMMEAAVLESGGSALVGSGAHRTVGTELEAAVYAIQLPANGAHGAYDADMLITASAHFSSVLSLGDASGDGVEDLLIAAGGSSTDQRDAITYRVDGPLEGTAIIDDAYDAALHVDGDKDVIQMIQVGDQDGDGLLDSVLGSPNGGPTHAGRAYLVPGPLEGEVSIGDVAIATVGVDESGESYEAYRVESVGDLDGDGVEEWVLTVLYSPEYPDQGGGLFVFSGVLAGTIGLSDAKASFLGEGSNERVGTAVASGDMDGDGDIELIVSAPRTLGTSLGPGKVYAIGGPFAGAIGIDQVESVLDGEAPGDHFGLSLLSFPDVGGDGRNELVIAAPYSDALAQDGGRVYLTCSDGS
jgi:hypothetical protein